MACHMECEGRDLLSPYPLLNGIHLDKHNSHKQLYYLELWENAKELLITIL